MMLAVTRLVTAAVFLLLAAPLDAEAQKSAPPTVGFLCSASSEPYAPFVAAFRDGLKEGGRVEGANLAIEFRWADGAYERLPRRM